MNTTESKQQRTPKQRKAIEVYCREVADALDREGHTLQNVVAQIKKAEIRPTQENIKEVVFKPIAKVLFSVESTTELDTTQVDRVYEVMNKWLGDNFEIHVPFPTIHSILEQKQQKTVE